MSSGTPQSSLSLISLISAQTVGGQCGPKGSRNVYCEIAQKQHFFSLHIPFTPMSANTFLFHFMILLTTLQQKMASHSSFVRRAGVDRLPAGVTLSLSSSAELVS